MHMLVCSICTCMPGALVLESNTSLLCTTAAASTARTKQKIILRTFENRLKIYYIILFYRILPQCYILSVYLSIVIVLI